MNNQFLFFCEDINRMLGKQKLRIIIIWMSRSFWGIALYRFERTLFLLFKNYYAFLRILFLPIYNLIQAYSNIDIHYKADIKGGISILHPSMGVVISGNAKIGNNLCLTGGNVIGIAKMIKDKGLIIGNNCTMGANAVILGPIQIADSIKIGALACVIKDCLVDEITLVGTYAKEKYYKNKLK